MCKQKTGFWKTKSDKEKARYCPDLEEQLRECMAQMRQNKMLFDLETEPELVEQLIYEGRALQCRYEYLMRRARAVGLRTLL